MSQMGDDNIFAACEQSSEVCGIIKPDQRVKLNAVNVPKLLTIRYLQPRKRREGQTTRYKGDYKIIKFNLTTGIILTLVIVIIKHRLPQPSSVRPSCACTAANPFDQRGCSAAVDICPPVLGGSLRPAGPLQLTCQVLRA